MAFHLFVSLHIYPCHQLPMFLLAGIGMYRKQFRGVDLNAKEGVFLTDIICVYDNAILAKDSSGAYWRLDFLQ